MQTAQVITITGKITLTPANKRQEQGLCPETDNKIRHHSKGRCIAKIIHRNNRSKGNSKRNSKEMFSNSTCSSSSDLSLNKDSNHKCNSSANSKCNNNRCISSRLASNSRYISKWHRNRIMSHTQVAVANGGEANAVKNIYTTQQ